MDFDFSRHSWRSFEQMVQSLAMGVFGTQTIPFGDGPDGGREALVPAPFQFGDETVHAGEAVLQAKFRQRTHPDTDSAWAVNELKKELKRFRPADEEADESDVYIPDCYVFVTNVNLSSAEGGGKDQVEAALQAALPWGPPKWQIWDYDKLRTLLENNEAVRTAHLGWITPGDVLARLMAVLDDATPEFAATLVSYLEKELISEQFANLEQAGHSSDEALPLSQVFVDLPSSSEANQGDDAGQDFLRRAITLADRKLDHEAIKVLERQELDPDELPPSQRLVLVGGPGQGKSTLGQYLCQLFRATLLADRKPDNMSYEGRTALRQVVDGCKQIGLALPQVHRFPLRVVLSDFADALADDDAPPKSLVAYLAAKISAKVNTVVSPLLMQRWLERYPWLLVLDGLDEVPASSNRADVLKLVTEFWVDVSASTCDVLVLATTRPQGYNDDFSPAAYRHEYLVPLSDTRALAYAERLIPVRYRGDEERQAKVRGRLQRAVSGPTTRRLMTTPLQVTIMTALVDRMGQPPQERWTLFNEYYNTVYLREMERSIPAASVLRDFRPEVDVIHRRVALLLQTTAETRSHVEARLSSEELRAIVLQRLQEKGHEGEDATALAEQIVEAAELRLVFLVGAEADQIGFEIRSLQEFMAAEALVDGLDGAVLDRLRTIAPYSSWRNVFLFAAGHCYLRRADLIDGIVGFCAAFNEDPDDPLTRGTLAGSELALQLLEDGGTQNQPLIARTLTRLACRLLSVADPALHSRLVAQHTAATDAIYREELRDAVLGSSRVAALRCLSLLDRADVSWAAPLLRRSWPADRPARRALVGVTPNSWSPATVDLVTSALAELKPEDVPCVNRGWVEAVATTEKVAWLAPVLPPVNRRSGEGRLGRLPFCGNRGINLYLSPSATFGDPGSARAPLQDSNILALGRRFAEDPSPELLGDVLEQLATLPVASWSSARGLVPWPIGACLRQAADSAELHRWALDARMGRFGSSDAWSVAEARWETDGVTEEDLLASNTSGPPFDEAVAHRGFPPLTIAGWAYSSGDKRGPVKQLSYVLQRLRPGPARAAVAQWLVQLAGLPELTFESPVIDVASVVDALRGAPHEPPFKLRCRFIRNLGLAEDDVVAGRALDDLLGQAQLMRLDVERDALPAGAVTDRVRRLVEGGHSSGGARLLAVLLPTTERSSSTAISSNDPRNRAGAALWDALGPDPEGAGSAFGAAWDDEDDYRQAITTLANADPSRCARFLDAALDAAPADRWTTRPFLTGVLRDLSLRRQSPLLDPACWQALKLFERPER
jgi:hypothetical protein